MYTAYSYTGERHSYRSHQVTLEVLVVVTMTNTPADYKMATITAVKKGFATDTWANLMNNLWLKAYSYTGERDRYRSNQVMLEVVVVVIATNTPAHYKMATITAVKNVLIWRHEF